MVAMAAMGPCAVRPSSSLPEHQRVHTLVLQLSWQHSAFHAAATAELQAASRRSQQARQHSPFTLYSSTCSKKMMGLSLRVGEVMDAQNAPVSSRSVAAGGGQQERRNRNVL